MSNQRVEKLKEVVINAMEDLKANDIICIDISKKTSMADYMIVASGTSNRHLRAIVDNAAVEVKQAGFDIQGKEGSNNSEWVLIDFGDIILHCMMPEARTYYDLERLWQGARPTDAGHGLDDLN
jgi:ribosome-associated protein